jgi:sigma-B regulation protein RsbU (phosphoserine phosphatase)
VLYTDGLTEARRGVAADERYTENALIEFASEHSPATAAAIVNAIRSLLEGFGEGVEDDAAVLAISVQGPGVP